MRILGIRPVFVPAPSVAFAEIWAAPAWFFHHALYTTGISLAGFLAAAVCCILFAILIVEWKFAELLLYPLFVGLNSVPKVAVAPLFIIWFGTGAEPKIAISFLVALFSIVVDTTLWLRSVPPAVVELTKVLIASRWKSLTRVKLYRALPHIFSSLKIWISLALVGAIVGEFITAQRGLGYVIMTAQGAFDTPRVFAALLILAALGVLLIAMVEKMETYALPWRQH